MSKGFDDIELMEHGFSSRKTDVDGDYYYQFEVGKTTFITRETKKELKRGQLFTLIMLTDVESTAITSGEEFISLVKIFGRQ